MKEETNENVITRPSRQVALYLSLGAMIVIMFLLTFNTGDWRVVSQKIIDNSECRVEIQDNSFQVMLRSLPLALDSMRINLSRDSASSGVTIIDCQRDMRFIGEPDRTAFAEVTVLAPQIQSTTFTLRKKL